MPEDGKRDWRRWFRFSRSTVALSSLLVLVPWMLVAMPGVSRGYGGSSASSVSYRAHGWPFVFLETSSYDFNERFPATKPTAEECDLLAQNGLVYCFGSVPNPEFDLRLLPANHVWSSGIQDADVWAGQFWTSLGLWPVFNKSDGYASRICWIGLALDVVVLIAIWLITTKLLEMRRRRRGRHFAFTLMEGLLAMTVVGLLMAILAKEYRRSRDEMRIANTLVSEIEGIELGFINGTRHNSLPVLISQLIDHRSKLPFTGVHLFRPVSDVFLEFDPRWDPKFYTLNFISAIKEAKFDIDLKIGSQNYALLRALADANSIAVLRLEYDYEIDVENGLPDDFGLDFKIELPKVKRVTVTLQEGISQKIQLFPFMGMTELESLTINELDSEGIKFLMASRTQIPSNTFVSLAAGIERSDYPDFASIFPEAEDEY